MQAKRLIVSTGLCSLLLSAAAVRQMSGQDLNSGQRALMQGRIPDAVASLSAAITANPRNGQAHLFLCRAYYSERVADAAVRECEAALETLSHDSAAQDWMGKAYGLKAEHADPLTGYTLAKKVKAAFETAVNLNPANGDAVDDLGDFYIQAPYIAGGGLSKAKALAARTRARNPELAFRLDAAIAEKDGDLGTAERLLKLHVESSRGRPDTWLDLGAFYQRRSESEQAVEAFGRAITADRDRGSVLVAAAEALMQLGRGTDVAERALREYLSGNNTNDSAPSFDARVLLGQLLAQQGNKAAARMEFNKALTLAPGYVPAKKALAAL